MGILRGSCDSLTSDMAVEPDKGKYPTLAKQDKVGAALARAKEDLRSASTEEEKTEKRLALFDGYVLLANLVQEHGEVPECELWSRFRKDWVTVIYNLAEEEPSPEKDEKVKKFCSSLVGTS